jgi:hypothetical protein
MITSSLAREGLAAGGFREDLYGLLNRADWKSPEISFTADWRKMPRLKRTRLVAS